LLDLLAGTEAAVAEKDASVVIYVPDGSADRLV